MRSNLVPMSFLSPDPEALRDGRQSPAAADICRGVARLLRAHGMASLAEVQLANGRRADVVAIATDGEIWIAEIKSSIEDFRADAKWHDYLGCCDAYYFAVMDDFPRELLPAEHGLIIADEHDAVILREAPHRPMPASRRRAQILRFGLVAAQRLSYATGFAPVDQDWRED